MRFLLIILSFILPCAILHAQDKDLLSNSTPIRTSEKKALEAQFKALGDYTIDDTGLVVYKTDSNKGSSDRATDLKSPYPESKPVNVASVPIVNTDEKNTSKNVKVATPATISKPINVGSLSTAHAEKNNTIKKDKPLLPPVSNNANVAASINTDKSDAIIITKEVISPTQNIVVVEPKNETKPLMNSEGQLKMPSDVVIDKNSKQQAQTSGSVFNRRRRSQYKNMEEAAMAVESLLEELKREQVTSKASGSMSSRLSKGVTKDLRSNQSSSTSSSIKPAIAIIEAQDEESANEPSYFINGVQVDKSEVLKLSKNNIINREIRVRNTVTNNPNGEVWYTVKEN